MFNQPMYGQQQPMYGGQQPGFQQPGFQQPSFQQPGFQQGGYGGGFGQQGPTVIHIDNDNDGSPCQFCGGSTDHIVRKTIGCVAISWIVCLLCTTGFLCCIPCCSDGCKDSELVCVKCQQVKNTIPANCC